MRIILVLLVLVFFAGVTAAEEVSGGGWPHFLGPNQNLHTREPVDIVSFDESGPELLWEVEKGHGHPGPVVFGDTLVYLHRIDQEEEVIARSAETGDELWKHRYPVEVGQSYGIVDAPRAGPTFSEDGEVVLTVGNEGDVHAFASDSGAILWSVSLPEVYGEAPSFFGYGSSPLIRSDVVYLQAGTDEAGVVALDLKTGRELWRCDHSYFGSFASPILVTLHGEERLLVFAGGMTQPPVGGLVIIDPSDGTKISEFPWRSENFASVNASTPVPCGENRIFITEDYGKGGVMLQVAADGSLSTLWRLAEFGCQFQTPVYRDGILYGLGGSGGLLLAVEAASGQILWSEMMYDRTILWQGRDLPVSLGKGHLVCVGESFLMQSENGSLFHIELNRHHFTILSKARLHYAPETWSPPVIAGGRLFVVQSELGRAMRAYRIAK